MSTNFRIIPDPGITITSAELKDLSIRHFNIIVLVEPDAESWGPKNRAVSMIAQVWNDVRDELINFPEENDVEDAATNYDFASGEVDILLIRIGSTLEELASSVGELAYVVFPQGFIQPYYDVLKHFGYWLKGVKSDYPQWRAAVIGATLEDEVARTANLIQSIGIQTTILERYCIGTALFREMKQRKNVQPKSYGEMTAENIANSMLNEE